MKTIPPFELRVNCSRGSPMGRYETLPQDKNTNYKLHLRRVPGHSGDYDKGGAYWGGLWTNPLYCAWNDEFEMYIRIANRNKAKEYVKIIYPNARFFN